MVAVSAIYFRHNKFRESQKELIKDCITVLNDKKILLAHAPTGLGKTDAVLGSCFTWAWKNNLSILFLTPKISQHFLALDVLKGI
ncbi:MAG: ATP-dependent DNA helicase, partial [archaeon]